jgi:hypothetical protein
MASSLRPSLGLLPREKNHLRPHVASKTGRLAWRTDWRRRLEPALLALNVDADKILVALREVDDALDQADKAHYRRGDAERQD